ncbi:defensin-like protein [Setaria italica]|nr:defensin-like protein [Setaria italica]
MPTSASTYHFGTRDRVRRVGSRMASTSRRAAAPVLFFLLLLLVASEMGTTRPVAEARRCVSQSHKFVGSCMRKSNCQHVCQTEGFPWGECRFHGGLLRRCFCNKLC